VIELFPNRFEEAGYFRIVHHPTEFGITLARNDDLGIETMAMQASALVRFGQIRQQMGRFELKGFPEFKFHQLKFQIAPRNQVPEGWSPIVSPCERGILHFAKRANSRCPKAREFEGQFADAVALGGKADR
jgi:hypothetical protein